MQLDSILRDQFVTAVSFTLVVGSLGVPTWYDTYTFKML